MANQHYNIILADDHQILRESLADFLSKHGHTIVAQLESFDALQSELPTIKADIVISDCRMDGCGPVNFLHHLKQHAPDMKIIYLSGMQSELVFHQLIVDEAHAIVSKKNGLNEVLKALDALSTDIQYVSPEIESLLNKNTPLTSMEIRVLEYLVTGLSNTEIAKSMFKSPATVNSHRTNIMKKLEVHNIVDLMKYCQRNGLFDS